VDGLELAAAVDLLGDVGQVKIGGEGAHQPGRAHGVERGEEVGGGLAIGADQMADALEEVEEIGSLLADERAAEHGAELRDVAAQAGLPIGHACTSDGRW
jgi:hypothetical protein